MRLGALVLAMDGEACKVMPEDKKEIVAERR